jgi:hypothetical protein
MRFLKVSLATLQKVPTTSGNYQLVREHYWATDGNGNAFKLERGSHQCNPHKKIVESIIKTKSHPATEVVFIESAWLPLNISDYT